MDELKTAIETMTHRIAGTLEQCSPSVYLYGFAALNDFKFGWSDIDILVLTEREISETQALRLVALRQEMLKEEPENRYYRLFEGGMLTLSSFLSGNAGRVIYWGTSGERIAAQYAFDAFCMSELLDSGVLLYGKDIRDSFSHPDFDALRDNVKRHYGTIRKYAGTTGRSFYTYGWLLDISRCIYTLRTGKIIAKTAAGEWALKEKLCPCEHVLAKAVEIRSAPDKYKNDTDVLDYAETISEDIQRYADVLERELKNAF
ncbi:MAG: aminoglycoside adenylyltransferase domain-containing protein [Oscillospiraceae bacterium]